MTWEGFSKYLGVQGIVTLLLVGCYCYMVAMNLPVSPEFQGVMTIVIGFTFGKNGTNYLQALRGGGGGGVSNARTSLSSSSQNDTSIQRQDR
jgi:hypothetical protein